MEFQNKPELNPSVVTDNLSHEAYAIRHKSFIASAKNIVSEIESHVPQVGTQLAVQAVLGVVLTMAQRRAPGLALAAEEISSIVGTNTLGKASLASCERALFSAIENETGNAVKTARVVFDKDRESPIDLTGISQVTDAKLASLYWNTWSSTVRVENTNSRNEVLGKGTAFFVTKSGQLLTNFHVTAGGEKLAIIEGDGTRRAAFLIDADPGSDLALIKVEPNLVRHPDGRLSREIFEALPLAFGERLKPGDILHGFGHNGVLDGLAMSPGLVVGKPLFKDFRVDRLPARIAPEQEVIESRMGILSGFSGGPLFNTEGRVVGVNFASNQQGRAGAIPIDAAKRLINSGMRDSRTQAPMTAATSSELLGMPPEATDVFNANARAVVKLRGKNNQGSYVYGTGTIVDSYVITDQSIATASDLRIAHNGQYTGPLQVKEHFPNLNASVLSIPWGSVSSGKRITLTENLVTRPGQRLFALGYPASWLDLHAVIGDASDIPKKISAPLQSSVSSLLGARLSETPDGFRGAPLFNRRGELAGTLVTSTDSSPIAISSRAIQEMLDSIDPLKRAKVRSGR